ncbi:MAG: hypothetical protein R3331_12080 [Sulfurospirillaceae bacterium]|nr:hypothetical protein [Sulfurospirillaceae bacterium]
MHELKILLLTSLMIFFTSCWIDSSSDTKDTTTEDNITLDDFADVVPYNPYFTSLHFSGSQNCALCHDNIFDTVTNKDVSIVKAWHGTIMGHASIDPLYLAKVASEVKRNPNFKEVIEAKCSSCHMPMAYVDAKFIGDPTLMFGDGFLNVSNPHYDAAKDGVSCTLCHQIENTPELGTDAGFSGKFVIAENFGTDRTIYGPYLDPKQAPMINNVEFTPVYGAQIEASKLCATCHNLNTPVIDADGNLTSDTFPEQAVYTEWEYSDYNGTKNCQDCHMPITEGSVVISTRGTSLTARSPFHEHRFIGANTYMLEIIKNNRIKLGSIVDEARLDQSITDTREFLKAAADVNITTISYVNGTLAFSVLIRNHSGHKFPTSLPIHRAWLHVKVTNDTNQSVFESGAFDVEGGIVGVDGITNGYQIHHDKITNPSEVQVYESIMADTSGQLTYTFMNASRYLKDNRILPLGYKSTTPSTAQPYGEALNDTNFVGGSDTVDYEVSGLPSGIYNISVTLMYETFSHGFTQDLFKDTDLREVALMRLLDTNTTNHYETVSADTAIYTP